MNFRRVFKKIESRFTQYLKIFLPVTLRQASAKLARNLRGSVSVVRISIGDASLSLKVGSGLPYAHMYEVGSGPWRIFPRIKRALAFIWTPSNPQAMRRSRKFIGYAGRRVLFRYVDHPAVQPLEKQGWLRTAVVAAAAAAINDIDDGVDAAVVAEIKDNAQKFGITNLRLF